MVDVVDFALAVLGYVFGFLTALYFDDRRRKATVRTDSMLGEALQGTRSLLEDLGLLTSRNLKPLGPTIYKAVCFSVLEEIGRQGETISPESLVERIELEDPTLARVWLSLQPDKASRVSLVEDVLSAAKKSLKGEPAGTVFSDGTRVPYNQVIPILGTAPFSRLARWSRDRRWTPLIRVSVGICLLPSFLYLLNFLAYPPEYSWPVWIPLCIAGVLLLLNYQGKESYREEAAGRWEYSVTFAPGNFLEPPTMVEFGRFCPAGVFVPASRGAFMVRVWPDPESFRSEAGAEPETRPPASTV